MSGALELIYGHDDLDALIADLRYFLMGPYVCTDDYGYEQGELITAFKHAMREKLAGAKND